MLKLFKVFFWGEFEILGGGGISPPRLPQKIAGINTAKQANLCIHFQIPRAWYKFGNRRLRTAQVGTCPGVFAGMDYLHIVYHQRDKVSREGWVKCYLI